MKFLLINHNPIVRKLVEASATKAKAIIKYADDLEELSQQELENCDYVIIDDECLTNVEEFFKKIGDRSSCLIYDRNSEPANGFSSYIRKPFLPTDMFNIFACENNVDCDKKPEVQEVDNSIKLRSLDDVGLDQKFDDDFSSDFSTSKKFDLEEIKSDIDKIREDVAAVSSESSVEKVEELEEIKSNLADEISTIGSIASSEESPSKDMVEDAINKIVDEKNIDNEIENVDNSIEDSQNDDLKNTEETEKDTEDRKIEKMAEDFQEVEKDIKSAIEPLEEVEEKIAEVEDAKAPHQELKTNVLKSEDIAAIKNQLKPSEGKLMSIDNITPEKMQAAMQEVENIGNSGTTNPPSNEPAPLNVNDLINEIKNTNLESLKSLLDGMQLTINISFPKKNDK